jgi:hypothetical protein
MNKHINKQLSARFRISFIVSLIILALILFACGFHIERSHHGKIVDAETQAPLRDAAVIKRVYSHCPRPPAGGESRTLAIEETLTDKNGNYNFPLKFYSMPFLCFYHNTSFIYIKPGYFEKREIRSERNEYTKLYKMTHYLNFLYYRADFHSPSDIRDASKYYAYVINKNKTIKIVPVGEKGVLGTFEGRRFTKIYSSVNRSGSISYVPRSPSVMVYYVYDEIAKEWLTIDSRGKIVEVDLPALPQWYYFSSDMTWGWPIFANNDFIFYPAEKNPGQHGIEYKKGEVKYIKPVKGDISWLSGAVDSFLTIEDKGGLLCHYQNRKIHKCYKSNDLPSSGDDLVASPQFKYIAPTHVHGFYAVSKTPKYWHIYNFHAGDNSKSFVELGTFSSDREITAFTAYGSSLYVAFKNEGIRKYELGAPHYGKIPMKENVDFLENSKKAGYPDIYFLNVGWAGNDSAIYAVSLDDRIYRFSTNGIPDYQVEVEID